MPELAKYVHDENIRKFREKLRGETNPLQIQLLERLIAEEDSRYAAALHSLASERSKSLDAP